MKIVKNFLVPCENFILDTSGKVTIVNIFEQILVDKLPVVYPKLVIVGSVELSAIPTSKTSVKVAMKLLNPAGMDLSNGTFIQDRNLVEDLASQRIGVAADLANLLINEYGKYKITLSIDEKEVAPYEFEVKTTVMTDFQTIIEAGSATSFQYEPTVDARTAAKSFLGETLITKFSTNISELIEMIKDLRDQIKFKSTTFPVTIYDLNDVDYSLNCPLTVLINKEDDRVYSELVDFNIFGEGESDKDAIDDLKSNLIVYFQSLDEESTKLSDQLKSKLNLLKKVIIINEK